MQPAYLVKRTTTADPDFQSLIRQLDHELWNELQEDQATYDQYNKVPDIKTAVLVYVNEKAVASGCFKAFSTTAVEVKRMYVQKDQRGKGFSRVVLEALEQWAREEGYSEAVLETSIHFKPARALYTSAGYHIIPNYGPYAGLEESVCMQKKLV
jgi:putative acetyltransferase